MARKKTPKAKKYYTIAEANATLPLVQAIVRDITVLANDLRERHERLARLQNPEGGAAGTFHKEELEQVETGLQRDRERMDDYEKELRSLGVELKDYFSGLIDFPCRMLDREVYLCWRLGEPTIAFWHELDSGFAGRQRLPETGETVAQANGKVTG